MRFRLRMHEIIPREMANYRILDGRVSFIAPHLFEVSLCVKGAKKDDGWFCADVEFLFSVGGDPTGMQGEWASFISEIYCGLTSCRVSPETDWCIEATHYG